MDPQRTRRIYNRIGRLQDTQSFYERAAIDSLVGDLDLAAASRVAEVGCGTGKLAERLLRFELPPDATYLGTDISETMVRLAAKRLRPFGSRASIQLADATSPRPADIERFDRVILAYVLDLLPPHDVARVLHGVRGMLEPGGLVGLVSLTHGTHGLPRAISNAWTQLSRRAPALVGGCQPINLGHYLEAAGFRIVDHDVVTSWGITSEIATARSD